LLHPPERRLVAAIEPDRATITDDSADDGILSDVTHAITNTHVLEADFPRKRSTHGGSDASARFTGRERDKLCEARSASEPVEGRLGLLPRIDLQLNTLLSVAASHHVGRNRLLHGTVQALGGWEGVVEVDFLACPYEVR
jgi:hypothetical protein